MTAEEQGKDVFYVLYTGVMGALLSAMFKGVHLARRDKNGNPLSRGKIIVELSSAGAVGAVTAWVIDGIGLPRNITAAIIAMSGYVGGPLLDVACSHFQELMESGFKGLKTWLEEHGWSKS